MCKQQRYQYATMVRGTFLRKYHGGHVECNRAVVDRDCYILYANDACDIIERFMPIGVKNFECFTCEPLECHQCFLNNTNCKDPLDVNADGVRIVTCPTDKAHVCYRASGSTTISGFPVSRTQRDCIQDTMVQPCMILKVALQEQPISISNIECYTCSNDRCNKNATGMASGITILKIILLLPLLTSFSWRNI
ncbi:hypothetical protein B566_EDAN007751 [Ephemera danica]|nr:hypothetical protein B566_EDAN007751 [Ephemera danica]